MFHTVEMKPRWGDSGDMARFLDLGLPVWGIPMSAESIPIDREADIPLVEKRIAELGL